MPPPDWRVEPSPEPGTPTPNSGTPTPSPGTPTPPGLPAPPAPPAGAPLADANCSTGRIVHVRYVIDGDTIELDTIKDGEDGENGGYEHVRLVGIDTPETYPEEECYGPEATEETRALVEGQVVCLTYDPEVAKQSGNVDMYGRTLGYVFFGDSYSRFLDAELVSGGFAEDYPFTEGAVFEEYFAELEAYARSLELGMWGACDPS